MVFLAGGTGITPCYQVISEINNMKEEKVELILLVANKTEEDILLRPELEALKGRVKIYYTLDLPPEGWTGFTGYVSLDMLQKISPLEDPNTLYLYSGPAGMNKLIRELFNAKFPQAKLFKF